MTTFTKSKSDAPTGFFEAEAAGLRWLAVEGGTRVVEVIRASAGSIELERIQTTPPTAHAARAFGARLAVTHGAGAGSFGAAPDGWDGPLFIGRRELPRVENDSWGAFYAPGRVLPFLEPALANGFLLDNEAALVREACHAIAEGAFDDEDPPARIHGDLWAGNVLFSPAGVVLIDPAAHGGHRETDLAMLALFGTPYLKEIFAAYEEQAPLIDGWRERIPVHQLHPLAVHAAGHGRSYGIELAAAARATLELAAR